MIRYSLRTNRRKRFDAYLAGFGFSELERSFAWHVRRADRRALESYLLRKLAGKED